MQKHQREIALFAFIILHLSCFSLVSSATCGGNLTSKTGIMESPIHSHSDMLNMNGECIWEVSVPEPSIITLNLKYIKYDTYHDDDDYDHDHDYDNDNFNEAKPCDYYLLEFVSIKFKNNKSNLNAEHKYGPFCDSQLPGTIKAEGSIFRITYIPSQLNRYPNFKATYSIETDKCAAENGGCQHICENIFKGYKCLCRSGYSLHPNGHDCKLNVNFMAEANPQMNNARKAMLQWVLNFRNTTTRNERWGNNVARIAVALYMADSKYFKENNSMGNEIAYEVDSMILESLLSESIHPISETDLAIYIHALLVTCLDPRNFHGIDLVSKLRHQITIRKNNTSPLALLALCNAHDNITNEDIVKVTSVFYEAHQPIWTSTQALALIALSCMAEQSNASNSTKAIINDMSLQLQRKQNSNGSFENLHTTAFVIQSLFASGTENGVWNPDTALDFLVRSQMKDGSYGNFLNTYYVLPILYHKSLLNISSSHCEKQSRSEVPLSEYSDDFNHKGNTKIWIKYSLWFEDHFDVIRSIIIHVTKNCTFFDVMKKAQSLDNTYRFEYFISNSKPYVYALSGIQDNPENEKFWFLYKMNGSGLKYQIINSSCADVIPENKEEFVMWYRSGYWAHKEDTLFRNEILLLDSENGSGADEIF